MGMVNAHNKVPEHQRFYQAAYKSHQRLWRINPRTRFYMIPYHILLWGGLGSSLYMGIRKVFGHNTYFGKN